MERLCEGPAGDDEHVVELGVGLHRDPLLLDTRAHAGPPEQAPDEANPPRHAGQDAPLAVLRCRWAQPGGDDELVAEHVAEQVDEATRVVAHLFGGALQVGQRLPDLAL